MQFGDLKHVILNVLWGTFCFFLGKTLTTPNTELSSSVIAISQPLHMCVSPVSISDASSCAVRSTEYNEEDLNKTFYEIASTEISDKVASPGFKFWKTHNFDDIYQRYLGPLRSSCKCVCVHVFLLVTP